MSKKWKVKAILKDEQPVFKLKSGKVDKWQINYQKSKEQFSIKNTSLEQNLQKLLVSDEPEN